MSNAYDLLRVGSLNESVQTFLAYPDAAKHAARVKEIGNDALRRGDKDAAVSAFVVAAFVNVYLHERPTDPRRDDQPRDQRNDREVDEPVE